ncbi:MAG TPA: hypothetical protein VLQ45_16425 [Thermoanaerobaculia bacterium]|nr:hypothetical protein [Thermoanaerobaculia bacterium]
MKIPMAVLLLIIATSGSNPSRAQIVARQGNDPTAQVVHFQTPMVLDLVVSALADLRPGKKLQFAGNFRRYVCDDDVFFSTLELTKRVHDRRTRALELELSGYLTVLESYDRLADVTVRLVKNGVNVASGTTPRISAEEGKTSFFRVKFTIPENELANAFSSGPEPVLQITLSVRDNS